MDHGWIVSQDNIAKTQFCLTGLSEDPVSYRLLLALGEWLITLEGLTKIP